MLRFTTACLLCVTAVLPTGAMAQDVASPPPPKWVSHTGVDASGTRTCSVCPILHGPFPMIFFYGTESSGQLSVEGAPDTPLNLTLQVDANPELDGGFPEMSKKNTATLIRQIRADAQNLRLSKSDFSDGTFRRLHQDLPLAGAVEQLDTCREWLAHGKAKR